MVVGGFSETGLGMLSALVQPGIRVPQHGYSLGCWVGSGWCWWWRPGQDVMLSARGPCGHYQSKISMGVDLGGGPRTITGLPGPCNIHSAGAEQEGILTCDCLWGAGRAWLLRCLPNLEDPPSSHPQQGGQGAHTPVREGLAGSRRHSE